MAGPTNAISGRAANGKSAFQFGAGRDAVSRFLDRFSRVTTSGRFIPEIDGLRFIAIGLVVLFHLSGFLSARSSRHFTTAPGADWLGGIASQGHYGVQLLTSSSFFVGFLLADVYLMDWKQAPNTRWYWDVVTIAGWPAMVWLGRSPLLVSFALPIMFFVLYCAMFRGPLSNWLIRNRCITTIGGMCYSTYLLHYQVLSAVMRHTSWIGFTDRYWVNVLLQVALTMPFLLVIAGIYFLLIEQPCMRKDWPQRMAHWMRRQWDGRAYAAAD
jgi:peptidoglycan/LPS O-acetylase OafA/YrhL